MATNDLVIDSVRTFATYHCVGVRAYYSNDDDSNATASAFLVAADSATGARDSVVFYRSQDRWPSGTARKFFAASILWLGSNRNDDSTFLLYPRFSDPAGVSGDVGSVRIATRENDGTTATLAAETHGKQIWMGPFGSDVNSGLDANHPLLTFPAAVAKVSSNGGDQICLLRGTYYAMRTDTFDTRNVYGRDGTGSRHDGLIGTAPGVVISGADTASLAPSGWKAVDIGGGTIAYVHAFAPGVWPRAVVLGDSARLYPYETFCKFRADPVGIARSNGCFWVTADGDSVYIRPPTDLVPAPVAGHTLGRDARGSIAEVRVPRFNTALRVRSAFWRIDSLTVRDFGTGRNDVGISLPVVSLANQGNVVEHCTFDNNGRPAVGVVQAYDSTLRRTQWNTIQCNSFFTTTLGQTWNGPSRFVGYDRMELLGCRAPLDTACGEANIVYPQLILEAGRGHVVRWNTFYGGPDASVRFADANDATNFTRQDTTSYALNDIDLYQNVIVDLGDDAIEPDPTVGINVRIFRNVELGGHDAMNYQVLRGPTYFVFNTCINQVGGILPHGADDFARPGKYNLNSSRGHLIVANNTFASRRSDANDVWAQPQNADRNGGNAYVNQHVLNNLLGGNTGTIVEDGCRGLNEFNWNVHNLRADTTFRCSANYGEGVRALNGLGAGSSSWRDWTGYGRNDGRTAMLEFADSLHWDWSPRATWRDVLGGRHARSLPGINTNLAVHQAGNWFVNPSGSSDSTYVGAWMVNGMRLEGVLGSARPPVAVQDEK